MSSIRVNVNGEVRELPAGSTVRSLVEAMGLGKAACAAEVNKAMIPRRQQDSTMLKDGDRVELVTLVGGG